MHYTIINSVIALGGLFCCWALPFVDLVAEIAERPAVIFLPAAIVAIGLVFDVIDYVKGE